MRCLSQAGAAPPRWTRDRNAPAAWLGVGAERKPCKRGPITVRDYALVGPTELFLEIPRLDPLKTSSHPPAGCTPPPLLPHKLRFRASTAWLGGAETQVPVAFLRILLPRWCDMSPPPPTAFYPPLQKTCFEIPGWPDYWKRAPPSLTTLPPLQVCSLLQYGALVPCLRRRRAAYCTAAAPHLRRSYVVSAQPVASDRSATATQCSAVTPLVGRGAGISMLARGC